MNVTAILILMITFFALIFLGFHISYSMMASAAVTILYLGLSPTQVVNTMVDGIDGFTLLFVLSAKPVSRVDSSDKWFLSD